MHSLVIHQGVKVTPSYGSGSELALWSITLCLSCAYGPVYLIIK